MTPFDLTLALSQWTLKSVAIFAVAWLVTAAACRTSKSRRTTWITAFLLVVATPMLGSLAQHPVEITPSASLSTTAETATWPIVALALWTTGTTICLATLAGGLVGLRRILVKSRRYQQLGHAHILIATTGSPAVALTWGRFIVLPRDSAAWTDARRQMVILHELAHIRRRDDVFHLLIRLVCALLWFNPAVWLAAHALRSECEKCADESVVESGVLPSDYAATLLATALEARGRRPLAGVAFMRVGELEKRVTAIVRYQPARRSHATLGVAALLLATLALATVQASPADPKQIFSKVFLDGYKAGLAYSRAKSGEGPPSSLTAADRMRIEREAQKHLP